MWRKQTSSPVQIVRCLHCAKHGRNYSQGHPTQAKVVAAQQSSKPATRDEEADLSSPNMTDANLHAESVERKKLQLTLAETSNLVEVIYKKGTHEKRFPPLAWKLWNNSIQAFDVRFHRGSPFLKDIPEATNAPLSNMSGYEHNCNEEKVVKKRLRKTVVPCLSGKAYSFHVHQKVEENSQIHQKPERKKSKCDAANPVPQPFAATEEEFTHLELMKIDLFQQQMSSFVRLCIQSGELETARRHVNMFLVNCSQQTHWFKNRRVLEPNLPNILLQAYAQQGRLAEALSFFETVKQAGIAPNTPSYVWLLRAALRSEEPRLNINKVLEMAIKQGKLSSLLSASNHPDLRNYPVIMSQLVEEMKVLHPELTFEPRSDHEMEKYSNSLVDDLNEPVVMDNPHAGVISPEQLSTLVKQHLDTEWMGNVEITSVLPVEVNDKVLEARSLYDKMKDEWGETITRELSMALEELDSDAQDDIHTSVWLSKFLHCMPLDQLVSVLLYESEKLCEMSETYSPHLSHLNRSLANAMRRKYLSYRATQQPGTHKMEALHAKYMQAYDSPTHPVNFRQMCERLDKDHLLDLAEDDIWPSSVTEQVGATLYKILLRALRVPSYVYTQSDSPPLAFYTVLRWNSDGQSKSKQVKPHPAIVSLIQTAQLRRLIMDVETLPMRVVPVPWRDQNKGPFLVNGCHLLRTNRGNYFGESDRKEVLPVLDAVNILSSVPWTINNSVFPHLLNVFTSGGNSDLDIPVSPSKVFLPPDSGEKLNMAEKAELLKKLRAEANSERMSFNLGLSIANHFNGETFWLPHNLDFRGRSYPLSNHLSQVSSDSKRSLLKFAKGKPLGERGLEWLKIHLINLSGFKKRESNAARLAYADEVLPLAFQSAASPFEGEQWWQTLDEPWQGLAACLELKAAYDSGDPTSYVSNLPIHQDGSCNGLQHYAAIGRDVIGAAAVNVSPADSPRDTYSEVAVKVEALRARDAANGHQIAKLLEGHVTRKVVKQTVMTKVYGVTIYGAQKQIQKHLAAQATHVDNETCKKAAIYLADRLMDTMTSMFDASTEIQDWLTLCAHKLTSEIGKPVSWKTPLGLTVTQNYWSDVKCAKSNYVIPADSRHDPMKEKPNVEQNKNAFPPNFVHSLDATHMMLTALRCQRAGIVFASIHDCFWTHASDVDTLNKICRESFYNLYQQPILHDLSSYFLSNYIDPINPEHEFVKSVLSSIPKKGDLDLSVVKDSEYFFS